MALLACELSFPNGESVESDSCIGPKACFRAESDILGSSCIGNATCAEVGADFIDTQSCVGDLACANSFSNGQTVGQSLGGGQSGFSCVGKSACASSSAILGSASCQKPFSCSLMTAFQIFDESCVGEYACSEAFASSSRVGGKSCLGHSSCFRSMADTIEDDACIGT